MTAAGSCRRVPRSPSFLAALFAALPSGISSVSGWSSWINGAGKQEWAEERQGPGRERPAEQQALPPLWEPSTQTRSRGAGAAGTCPSDHPQHPPPPGTPRHPTAGPAQRVSGDRLALPVSRTPNTMKAIHLLLGASRVTARPRDSRGAGGAAGTSTTLCLQGQKVHDLGKLRADAPSTIALPASFPGYRVKGVFYGWSPAHGHLLQSPPSCPSYVPVDSINNSDCWLHIRLYYCDVLVTEFTTHTAEGCRITYRPVPPDNERLYGPSCMEQIPFPPPRLLSAHSGVASALDVLERLLPHLDRGVLLWVAPEGVFMKRQCQGRVYWNGPLAPHRDRPNKLEREKTYKLLDTQQFLQQLRGYLSRGEPVPQYQIHLCFGEEFPASPGQNFQKLIMAHIEPVFARELFHCAQRMGPQLLQDSVPPSAADGSSHIIQILKQLCQP
uniref:Interferon regulatory factor-3 domain-containing protein n=1 Tax=Crocodylus porosus TaxID=8502 RepID=A0A7M4EL88_CROPO